MCETYTAAALRPDTATDFARDWWNHDRFRLLPGEEDAHTIFVIDFYDRCKYFGYTKELGLLPRRIAGHQHRQLGAQRFRHGTRSASPVHHPLHQIRSSTTCRPGRLRNMLVAQAPQNLLTPRGCVVQTANCWLSRARRSASPRDRSGEPAGMKTLVKPHLERSRYPTRAPR